MNRLSGEASPYLRQHETNPVDWYPWGDEAFARARELDRPILLSVGYSACHWCHVMAHESFESEATAAVMNELFVNVKVDREERPDIDAVYMEAVQAMTGRGGWPMTAFLFPDGRPFYAGTYFPPDPRHGMPSFTQLLEAIDRAWHDQRDDLAQQADELTASVRDGARFTGRSVGSVPAGLDPEHAEDAEDALRSAGPDLLVQAVRALMNAHDDEWGGFGRAPKFSNTMALELMIRAVHRGADERVLRALTTTLDCMMSGGMYDHLGGGFARYSVDERWIVPHFEKMLYDQAGLLRVYAHAHQVTGVARWRQVVDETVTYLARDLRLPGGGFASAEDADSVGEEGTFYVWSPAEVDEVLGTELGLLARAHWAITDEPNFEGRTIPTLAKQGALARASDLDDARDHLLAHRTTRVRPGLDDKVLTEWNAMIISALSEAGRALDEPGYVGLAVDAAQFLVGHLRRSDGRWLRTWHASSGPKHLAGAADLAALVDAFVRLSEATGEARWLSRATHAANLLLAHHEDPEVGGFFTVADDGEQLLVRQKDLVDNATPSATSTAAFALQRLAALTGEERYRAAAVRALRLVAETAGGTPQAFAHALCALDLFVDGPTEVVVAGPPSLEREALLDRYWSRHRPNAVLAFGEPTDSGLWAGRDHLDHLRAYVCRNFVCERPTDDPDELGALLGDGVHNSNG